MKRILMLIPNLDFGGAQVSFAKTSLLLRKDHQLHLVTFNKDMQANLEFGAPIDELEVSGSKNYLGKVISFIRRVRRLKAIKKRFEPEISISFLEGADYINILSRGNDKVWFYVHGSKVYDKNIRGWMGILRRKIFLPLAFSKADKILVVNDRIGVELIGNFGVDKANIFEMNNFFKIDRLTKLSAEILPKSIETLFNNYQTICVSGRLAKEKAIDRFIRVMPLVLSRINNVKLVIIGDGQELDAVVNACEGESLSYTFATNDLEVNEYDHDVFFFGYKSNPYPFIRKSTILVLPSLNEGMPNTVAEAMILGTPVVAANCPYGPFEMLSKGSGDEVWPNIASYGILMPLLDLSYDSVAQWSDAIIKLLETPLLSEKLSKAGLIRAQKFSEEDILPKWKSILKN